MKKAMEELEKKKKKTKPKKGEEEEFINQAEYKYLPESIIVEML